jgi:hypothetical protein
MSAEESILICGDGAACNLSGRTDSNSLEL